MIQKIRSLVAKLAYARILPLQLPCQNAVNDSKTDSDIKDDLSVYWIGHSLMNHTVSIDEGEINLFALMARFASEKTLAYSEFDHTLFGAPLSMHWWGSPHTYARISPEMEQKRNAFGENAKKRNTFVLTEVVPLKSVFRVEFSAHYLRKYYYRIKSENPAARIYLYESWDYLYGGSGLLSGFSSWHARMSEQRQLWETMIDMVKTGLVVPPNFYYQIKMILGLVKKREDDQVDINIVPVGQVLMTLEKRLRQPLPDDDFNMSNGEQLAFYQLFTNAYKQGVNDGSVVDTEGAENLNHPEQELDDIHPSSLGIYIVALVHFATLYQQNPEGLAPIIGMREGLASTLQKIVWECVCNDERSGVNIQN